MSPFDTYLHTVGLVDARIEQLERAIRETAEQQPWCELAGFVWAIATEQPLRNT